MLYLRRTLRATVVAHRKFFSQADWVEIVKAIAPFATVAIFAQHIHFRISDHAKARETIRATDKDTLNAIIQKMENSITKQNEISNAKIEQMENSIAKQNDISNAKIEKFEEIQILKFKELVDTVRDLKDEVMKK
jgi:hypothetical protein